MLVHSSSRETSDGFCIPKRQNTPSVNFIIILEALHYGPFRRKITGSSTYRGNGETITNLVGLVSRSVFWIAGYFSRTLSLPDCDLTEIFAEH
jgi:hypothetical protein